MTEAESGRRPPGFEIRRAYEGATKGTYRVLVDRLWPRGVSKAKARIDEWAKDITPSDELRRWYGHEPEKFAEFARRYRRGLARAPAKAVLSELRAQGRRTRVTLVTATRDLEHSGATVLLDVLEQRRSRSLTEPS